MTVPTQVYQKAPCNILDSPEIECSEDYNDDEGEDFFIQEGIKEHEGKDARALEYDMEKTGDWVQRVGEKRID